MKKTTARGAYRKGAKRAMIKRRAPMVETKRREHTAIVNANRSSAGVASANYPAVANGQTIANDDAYTLLSSVHKYV